MNRITAILCALATLAGPPLASQTKSAAASANVAVTANLSIAKLSDMQFGSHFASEGVVFETGGNGASWQGSTDVNNTITITMALPGALTRTGGGSVPFACGNLSLTAHNGTGLPDVNGDPAVPHTFGPITGDGSFTIKLGSGVSAAETCSVNLTGAGAGAYSGTITATVAVS